MNIDINFVTRLLSRAIYHYQRAEARTTGMVGTDMDFTINSQSKETV